MSHTEETRRKHQSGVYMYLSFDLMNSTAFKDREPRWPFVMHYFYVETVAAVRAASSRFHVWKYIGDEVTFWQVLPEGADLPALMRRIHAAVQSVRERLDGLQDKYDVRTRHQLGVKGTAWIASAEFVPASKLEQHLEVARPRHVNRILEERVTLEAEGDGGHGLQNVVDFIGPEIDIGFRLTKFAHNGFLLLNAPLASILLRQADEDSIPARVVSLEALKGVWGGRPYPVVWYCEPWDHPEENFAYDEALQHPIVARVLAGQTQTLRLVNRALRDMNLEEQVDHIAAQLKV